VCSQRAVSWARSQRQSCPPRECCPSSLALTFGGFAQAGRARLDAALVDVAGRALRRTWMARLSQPIRRGDPAHDHLRDNLSSASPTSGCAVASSLQLARSARKQRVVGTTATACHRGGRPRLSREQLRQEEVANKETIAMRWYLPLSES
jgi:hypothetical protein